MIRRAVYDAMVFFQWATLPPDKPNRQHATIAALMGGEIRLCLSADLLTEVRELLTRPELRTKYKTLTPEHVASILDTAMHYADWFDPVPARFALPLHPKDNHLFDLAIESKAWYFVTWETRLLKLRDAQSPDARHLRDLAPELSIVSPKELSDTLKLRPPRE